MTLGRSITIGISLFGLLLVSACKESPDPEESLAKVGYFIAGPAKGGSASYTGAVQARTESNLGFRISGKILERLVDPGQTVKAGQPLMKLDPTDYELATNAAKASVEAARARNIQAAADEVRLQKLLETGAVSKQAYEQVKAAADSSAAQMEAALAQYKQTRNQADYAVLKADAPGVVMDVPVQPGQVISAGQTVVKFAKAGAREAVINIPEQAISALPKIATAALYSDEQRGFPAKLRELSSAADPLTRTYQAKYTLFGEGEQAPLGATVTIHTVNDAGSADTLIGAPVSALIDKGDGPSVWVVDTETHKVTQRKVSIASLGEEFVTISSGIKAGEQVVAFGTHLLKQGQKVELLTQVNVGLYQ